mmetsp:Transcript_28758/g.95512  ORF Transcript_28758/g.95512 Transcript_28758/m.95512 type:complete len:344 (-) Transcript_28758:832-1863(-)
MRPLRAAGGWLPEGDCGSFWRSATEREARLSASARSSHAPSAASSAFRVILVGAPVLRVPTIDAPGNWSLKYPSRRRLRSSLPRKYKQCMNWESTCERGARSMVARKVPASSSFRLGDRSRCVSCAAGGRSDGRMSANEEPPVFGMWAKKTDFCGVLRSLRFPGHSVSAHSGATASRRIAVLHVPIEPTSVCRRAVVCCSSCCCGFASCKRSFLLRVPVLLQYFVFTAAAASDRYGSSILSPRKVHKDRTFPDGSQAKWSSSKTSRVVPCFGRGQAISVRSLIAASCARPSSSFVRTVTTLSAFTWSASTNSSNSLRSESLDAKKFTRCAPFLSPITSMRHRH